VSCNAKLVLSQAAASLAIRTGAPAGFGWCAGCGLMVRETQRAVKYLGEEAKTQAALHRPPQPPR